MQVASGIVAAPVKGNGIMDETEWGLVSMFLPSFGDVMEIHDDLVEMFRTDEDLVEPPSARGENLVHFACHRPQTEIGDQDKYLPDFDKAAALFHFLTRKHAFHIGNKRTALVTLLATLYRNNRTMDHSASDDELHEMIVAVANGSFLDMEGRLEPDATVQEISNWISSHVTNESDARYNHALPSVPLQVKGHREGGAGRRRSACLARRHDELACRDQPFRSAFHDW